MNSLVKGGGIHKPRDFGFQLPDLVALNREHIGFERTEANEFTVKQIETLNAISATGLKTIDEEYGTGFPDYTEPHYGKGKRYHNGYHGRFVGGTGKMLAQIAGLGLLEQHLTETAGHWHDADQGPGHEGRSAERLAKKLWSTEVYSKEQIEIAALAIKGTKVIFDKNDRIAGQTATSQEYPSKKAEISALCTASADLGLYLPQSPLMAQDLYEEITGKRVIDNSFIEFQHGQVDLADRWKFPLPEAEKFLTGLRPKIVKHNELILAEIERGNITTWDDLTAYNLNFLREHS